MKIQNASVIICSPGRNFVTLKIETDEGIFGLGDATLNGRELAVASYLSDHLIPCLIGRDPFQTEDIWQYFYRGAYWRRGPVTMAAIGAVDVALWDIKGKALNTPVYNLLGISGLQNALDQKNAQTGSRVNKLLKNAQMTYVSRLPEIERRIDTALVEVKCHFLLLPRFSGLLLPFQT